MARVAPLQRQLHTLASASTTSADFDWSRYRRLAVAWELWGAFALITPAAALVLMVVKPGT